MEETAKFYEKAFGMKRVREHESAIGLSDGVVSLVIIHPSNVNMKNDDRRGLHHLGFLVEGDMAQAEAQAKASGASFQGEILGTGRADGERKFRDPNGQIFDLTGPAYASEVWNIKVDEKATA
jgi:catechol-2,3-dioxygenase